MFATRGAAGIAGLDPTVVGPSWNHVDRRALGVALLDADAGSRLGVTYASTFEILNP